MFLKPVVGAGKGVAVTGFAVVATPGDGVGVAGAGN